MKAMVDRNSVEVRSFMVNVYDEKGNFAYGEDLGIVDSKFSGLVSNYETALTVAKGWIVKNLGKAWLNDFEVIAK